MRVVLDTNVLLISIPSKSKFRPIFDGLINGDYELAISNEIIDEYMEVIEQKANAIVANNIGELLLNLENVEKVEVYFKWNVIHQDYDDNKFVDCAVAANVQFVVTNDKHFNELKNIDFPKVDVIGVEDFLAEVEKLKK
jgi:putative PIN family toxin of toxin-antitoxin system